MHRSWAEVGIGEDPARYRRERPGGICVCDLCVRAERVLRED